MKMCIILSNKIALGSTPFSRVLQVCAFQVLFLVSAPSHICTWIQPCLLVYGEGEEERQSCCPASQFTTVACIQGVLVVYPCLRAENKYQSLAC